MDAFLDRFLVEGEADELPMDASVEEQPPRLGQRRRPRLVRLGEEQDALGQLFIIESEQIKALASFLSGLNGIREGGEPLLDRTMVLYGTPMGNANSHANTNLPILLAGGGFRGNSGMALSY